MTYSIGKRVEIPPKQFEGTVYQSWAELADDAISQDCDFREIRNDQRENSQYIASLYLQTAYEDYCRGASTRSIIDASRSEYLAKKAVEKWEDIRDDFYTDIREMVAQMYRKANT